MKFNSLQQTCCLVRDFWKTYEKKNRRHRRRQRFSQEQKQNQKKKIIKNSSNSWRGQKTVSSVLLLFFFPSLWITKNIIFCGVCTQQELTGLAVWRSTNLVDAFKLWNTTSNCKALLSIVQYRLITAPSPECFLNCVVLDAAMGYSLQLCIMYCARFFSTRANVSSLSHSLSHSSLVSVFWRKKCVRCWFFPSVFICIFYLFALRIPISCSSLVKISPRSFLLFTRCGVVRRDQFVTVYTDNPTVSVDFHSSTNFFFIRPMLFYLVETNNTTVKQRYNTRIGFVGWYAYNTPKHTTRSEDILQRGKWGRERKYKEDEDHREIERSCYALCVMIQWFAMSFCCCVCVF